MKFPTIAALAACTILLVSPASSQTLRLNLDQLEQASDAVVVGRTLSAESAWTADRSAILTRVVIQVQDPETGEAIGEQIVMVPGGRVGEYIHEVSDMPTFREDEEVAVFLTTHESGAMIVTGGWQGKLDVVRDSVTGEKRVLGAGYLLDADVQGFALESEQAAVSELRTQVQMTEFARRVTKLKRER
jgi:hypothetical protein